MHVGLGLEWKELLPLPGCRAQRCPVWALPASAVCSMRLQRVCTGQQHASGARYLPAPTGASAVPCRHRSSSSSSSSSSAARRPAHTHMATANAPLSHPACRPSCAARLPPQLRTHRVQAPQALVAQVGREAHVDGPREGVPDDVGRLVLQLERGVQALAQLQQPVGQRRSQHARAKAHDGKHQALRGARGCPRRAVARSAWQEGLGCVRACCTVLRGLVPGSDGGPSGRLWSHTQWPASAAARCRARRFKR